ncbi:MAG: hypothetical protein AAFP89_01945 [Bacteroidota bacterium]
MDLKTWKRQLQERTIQNLIGVLLELKESIQPEGRKYHAICVQLGRLYDIQDPKKVYEILKYAAEVKGKKVKDLEHTMLTYVQRERNSIRLGVLDIIRSLKEEDMVKY